MKQLVLIAAAAAILCSAGERKQLPGQAGNDNFDLEGSLVLGHDEITNLIGGDIGEGYVVAHMKVIPKGDKPVRVGPDDFMMVSRKDGQRCEAMSPSEIAGKGALIIKHGTADGSRSGWAVGGIGAGVGSSPGTVQRDVIRGTQIDDNSKANPALAALTAKLLPDKETKTPVEGLLYFSISGNKLKPKDLAIIYKGEYGKLVMEFEPVKR